jgi:hypothetical protein
MIRCDKDASFLFPSNNCFVSALAFLKVTASACFTGVRRFSAEPNVVA